MLKGVGDLSRTRVGEWQWIKVDIQTGEHTCFSSLIYAQRKSRAEQKEQASNMETCRYSSHWEMRQNAYMWGKSHGNINTNGKTNWETNPKKTRAMWTNNCAQRWGWGGWESWGHNAMPTADHCGKLHMMCQWMHGGLRNITHEVHISTHQWCAWESLERIRKPNFISSAYYERVT